MSNTNLDLGRLVARRLGALVLRGCTALERLPERLDAYFLDVPGCTSLRGWPSRASISVGRLSARGCSQLREVPPWLKSISQLDLRDCASIEALPADLKVSCWLDIAGTGIRSLPPSLQSVPIRWRGVPVDARVAFHPESITPQEVLEEGSTERRRVLLEKIGYERFLTVANGEILDEDRDPGGPRRLIKVPMAQDEDLICVSVVCPSTARLYVIRVPPGTKTCRQAVAWIAGFDDPTDYCPLIET